MHNKSKKGKSKKYLNSYDQAMTPKLIVKLLKANSSSFKNLMDKNKNGVLYFMSCQAAENYTIEEGSNKRTNLLKEISLINPNLIVIGANGNVVYDNKGGVIGVDTHNSKIVGGFIAYKNGKQIAFKEFSYTKDKNGNVTKKGSLLTLNDIKKQWKKL